MKEDLWKSIIKNNNRYEKFTILDKPAVFSEMFKDNNIPCVQLHSIEVYEDEEGKDIIGFCGEFKWEDGKIISLDYDSYTKNTKVYGYSWFMFKGEKCLDILVGNDW